MKGKIIPKINFVKIYTFEYYVKFSFWVSVLHLSRLFCCNHTCHCVNMVSVTSASRYITSASRYIKVDPRYSSVV